MDSILNLESIHICMFSTWSVFIFDLNQPSKTEAVWQADSLPNWITENLKYYNVLLWRWNVFFDHPGNGELDNNIILFAWSHQIIWASYPDGEWSLILSRCTKNPINVSNK